MAGVSKSVCYLVHRTVPTANSNSITSYGSIEEGLVSTMDAIRLSNDDDFNQSALILQHPMHNQSRKSKQGNFRINIKRLLL